MGFFANLFGYILNFIYNLIGSYGWAIILFCIIIKLLMLPLTIKQQKNLKKTEKLQEKMKAIQFKYKNDPEKLNQEMMELYRSEKINPFSGCFSAIIQIVLLLSIFYLVRSPLTYMKKIEKTGIDINKYYNILKQEQKITDNAYQEIDLIREIGFLEDYNKEKKEEENQSQEEQNATESETENQENAENSIQEEITEENAENKEENKYDIKQEELDKIKINMEFLGIDLSKVPMQSGNDWKVYIIPVLYVVISFISMRLATSVGKKKNNEEQQDNPMMQANRQMSYIFPILYLTITLFAPLGLALYWLVNSILMIIERIILNIFLKEKEEEIKYIEAKKKE